MKKDSYIDTRELASTFNEGDAVLFPIFTRGNTYAPHYGKVITVLESIGMVDVSTPMGTFRFEPHELVKDDSQDAGHLPDEGDYDSWDKDINSEGDEGDYSYARPWKTAKTYHNKRIRPLAQKMGKIKKSNEGISDMKLYDLLFKKYSGPFSDEEFKTALRHLKEASSYRTASKVGDCPKCRGHLHRKSHQLSMCDTCFWVSTPEDVVRRKKGKREKVKKGKGKRGKESSKDWTDRKDPLLGDLF